MKVIIRIALIIALLMAGFAAGFPLGRSKGFSTGSEWAFVQANILAREAGLFMPVNFEAGQFRVTLKQPKHLYREAWMLAERHEDDMAYVSRDDRALYAWRERRHQEGHAMGRDAARIRNPAVQYAGSGVTFCVEQGTIITSGTTGAGPSRSRDGGDNL